MLRRSRTVALSCCVGRLVGDDDELGVVVAALLAHGLDRHVVLGERQRHLREHARAVVDVDRHVVAGQGLAHRQHRPVGVRRLADAAGAREPVAGDGDQVAEHRGRGRRAAGAGAVEHQLPGRLGLHEDGVVGLAHGRQRVGARDHRGVHPDRTDRASSRSSQIASSLTTLPISRADSTSAAVTSEMPSR